jgi:hypothetical protein
LLPIDSEKGIQEAEISSKPAVSSKKSSKPRSENDYITTGAAVPEQLKTTALKCANIDYESFSALFEKFQNTTEVKSENKISNSAARSETASLSRDFDTGLSSVKHNINHVLGQTRGIAEYLSVGILKHDNGYRFRTKPVDKIADFRTFLGAYTGCEYITDFISCIVFRNPLDAIQRTVRTV